MRHVLTAVMLFLIMLGGSLSAQNISFVNSTLHTGPLNSVYVSGGYAFCPGDYSMHIVSITDPANPQLAGVYEGNCREVFVDGNYAYVTSDLCLYIIDVSDPTSPTLIGTYTGTTEAIDVFVEGNLAYVTYTDIGLVIVDISDPAEPSIGGVFFTDESPNHIYVSGNYAFLDIWSSGLVVVDVTTPLYPSLAGYYDNIIGYTWGMYVSGNYAYLACDDLIILDISNPPEPVLAGTYESTAYNVFVEGDHALICKRRWWQYPIVEIVNVSNPAEPVYEGNYFIHPGDYDKGIFAVDNRAYIIKHFPTFYYDAYFISLDIADFSDPSNPISIGSYIPTSIVENVYISGDYAYIATGQTGLKIYNLADPCSPAYAGGCGTGNNTMSLCVSDNLIFCTNEWFVDTDHHTQFIIIDANNITDPFVIATHDNYGGEIFLTDDYAFLVNCVLGGVNGLSIFDVSDPYQSELLTTMNEGIGRDVWVQDNYAYVCNYESDFSDLFKVIDISDIMNPVIVGIYNYEIPAGSSCIAIIDGYALVGIGGGLLTINISDPENPTFTSLHDLPGQPSDVHIQGNYAYITCYQYSEGSIQVIDISDPEYPVFAGSYNLLSYPQSVSAKDDYIYVADRSSLQILTFEPESGIELIDNIPTNYLLIQNYPNPFNISTTIKYEIPHQSHVTIDIYDVLGRKVASLIEQQQPAGNYQVFWHADDFSSGMYFYKLQAGEFAEMKKMLLLK